jgi:hypothetical protein
MEKEENRKFRSKIEDFEKRLISLEDYRTGLIWTMDIEDFSELAKNIYAAYKKYNYVFGRLKK